MLIDRQGVALVIEQLKRFVDLPYRARHVVVVFFVFFLVVVVVVVVVVLMVVLLRACRVRIAKARPWGSIARKTHTYA